MASTKQIREDQLAFVSELLYNSGKYRLPYDQQDKLTIEIHLQHLLTVRPVNPWSVQEIVQSSGTPV